MYIKALLASFFGIRGYYCGCGGGVDLTDTVPSGLTLKPSHRSPKTHNSNLKLDLGLRCHASMLVPKPSTPIAKL